MTTRKVAIVGSRDFPVLHYVEDYIRELPPGTILVSGGARGPDSVARLIAPRCGFGSVTFFPDWNAYGRRAGFVRNALIVDFADRVVAFWDGKSRGTKHSIGHALRTGKPVSIAKWTNQGLIWTGTYRYDW